MSKSKNIFLISASIFVCMFVTYIVLEFRSKQTNQNGKEKTVSLKSSISKEVPIGASSSQVKGWFKAHNIKFSEIQKKDLDFDFLIKQQGISAKNVESILTGEVTDSSSGAIEGNCKVNIAFFLNKENKYVDQRVEKICSGI